MRVSDPKPVDRVRAVEDTDETAVARPAKGAEGPAAPADRVSIGASDSAESPEAKKKDVDVAADAVRRELASSRSSHLASIEAAVRNGTYRPDPRLIAERILQSAALDAQIDARMRMP
jgi:negative regulator of flagellin synthesis FlgM